MLMHGLANPKFIHNLKIMQLFLLLLAVLLFTA